MFYLQNNEFKIIYSSFFDILVLMKSLLALVLSALLSITLNPDIASADKDVTNKLADRNALLESLYLELYNTYDPNYMIEDATCRMYRETEKSARSKNKIKKQVEKDEMESRILNLCKRSTWNKFSDHVGRFVDAGKNAFLLEDLTVIGERATHWALSKKTYDILTYRQLDKVLSEKCFPGKPDMNLRFKNALIQEDIKPAFLGTASGLIAGWFVLKGAGKVVFTPAKTALIERGAISAQTFVKIKRAGYLIGAPLLGLSVFYTVKEQKDTKEVAELIENEEQILSRISLEAMFPEPELNLSAQECTDAYQNIEQAPTSDLRAFWSRSAVTKCERFMSHAEYALNSLKNDDFNRCHPGNHGAIDRIEAMVHTIEQLGLTNPAFF